MSLRGQIEMVLAWSIIDRGPVPPSPEAQRGVQIGCLMKEETTSPLGSHAVHITGHHKEQTSASPTCWQSGSQWRPITVNKEEPFFKASSKPPPITVDAVLATNFSERDWPNLSASLDSKARGRRCRWSLRPHVAEGSQASTPD